MVRLSDLNSPVEYEEYRNLFRKVLVAMGVSEKLVKYPAIGLSRNSTSKNQTNFTATSIKEENDDEVSINIASYEDDIAEEDGIEDQIQGLISFDFKNPLNFS